MHTNAPVKRKVDEMLGKEGTDQTVPDKEQPPLKIQTSDLHVLSRLSQSSSSSTEHASAANSSNSSNEQKKLTDKQKRAEKKLAEQQKINEMSLSKQNNDYELYKAKSCHLKYVVWQEEGKQEVGHFMLVAPNKRTRLHNLTDTFYRCCFPVNEIRVYSCSYGKGKDTSKSKVNKGDLHIAKIGIEYGCFTEKKNKDDKKLRLPCTQRLEDLHMEAFAKAAKKKGYTTKDPEQYIEFLKIQLRTNNSSAALYWKKFAREGTTNSDTTASLESTPKYGALETYLARFEDKSSSDYLTPRVKSMKSDEMEYSDSETDKPNDDSEQYDAKPMEAANGIVPSQSRGKSLSALGGKGKTKPLFIKNQEDQDEEWNEAENSEETAPMEDDSRPTLTISDISVGTNINLGEEYLPTSSSSNNANSNSNAPDSLALSLAAPYPSVEYALMQQEALRLQRQPNQAQTEQVQATGPQTMNVYSVLPYASLLSPSRETSGNEKTIEEEFQSTDLLLKTSKSF